MARRDLTIEDVERMGKEEPGSAARYLEERRRELEREKEQQHEEDDKARFVAAFLNEGGHLADADDEWRAYKTERASRAARQADEAAFQQTRRHIAGRH